MSLAGVASFSGRFALPVAPQASSRCATPQADCCSTSYTRHADRFRQSNLCKAGPSIADLAPSLPGGKESGMNTVGDVMTANKVYYARPNTTINEALEILVHNSITGLPVINETGEVVGVVSDFDLLSLDQISGERETTGMFPDISTDWRAFEEVQKLILKNHGSVVEDVMTADPITVDKACSLERAARMLLDKRVRRLPVVDKNNKLIGMFSRADVIKAALKTRTILSSVIDSDDKI